MRTKTIISSFLLVCWLTAPALSDIIDVQSTTRFKKLVDSGSTLFVWFYALWCEECVEMEPIFVELNRQYGEEVIFVKIRLDKKYDICVLYEVGEIPDVRLFQSGEEKDQLVGHFSKKDYEEAIQKLL